MTFSPGLDIEILHDRMDIRYGRDVFGPAAERRSLDAIRGSLWDPACSGPDIVYAIAMDVGKIEHREELIRRMLLFGVVTYASGRLGNEPIRSQGHIHKISRHTGWSTPEIYEIWSGKAVILMQETAQDNPGRCFAVEADKSDVVVVPPYWAHATISADPDEPLTFGAWCDRDYGFEYDDVRRHGGLSWFPILSDRNIDWLPNNNYKRSNLVIKKPEFYTQLGICPGVPIYKQFETNPNRFQWVSQPALMMQEWISFIP